jgi:hypothetical protein
MEIRPIEKHLDQPGVSLDFHFSKKELERAMYSAIGAICILAKIVKPVFRLQASILHRRNFLMQFRLFVAICFYFASPIQAAEDTLAADLQKLLEYSRASDWGSAVAWLDVTNDNGKLKEHADDLYADDQIAVQERFIFEAGDIYVKKMNTMSQASQKSLGAPEAFGAWNLYLTWTLRIIDDAKLSTLQDALNDAANQDDKQSGKKAKAETKSAWENRLNKVLKSFGQAADLCGKWKESAEEYGKFDGRYHYPSSLDLWGKALLHLTVANPAVDDEFSDSARVGKPEHRSMWEKYAKRVVEWAESQQAPEQNRYRLRAATITKVLNALVPTSPAPPGSASGS